MLTILELVETLGMGMVLLVFLDSGGAKLFALETFRVGLLSVPYMKPGWSYPIAYILPVLELLAAVGIYLNYTPAKILALGLFLCFEAIIALTLWRKLSIGCHCFRSFGNRKLSKQTILTNLILMVFIVLDLSMTGLFLDVVSLLTALAILVFWVMIDIVSNNRKLIQENYFAGTP